MNYLSKAYEVTTSTTSTNQDLSTNCRRVRIHVASQPVFMAVGSVAQTVEGVPAETVALVTAAAANTAEVRGKLLCLVSMKPEINWLLALLVSVIYAVTEANQSDTFNHSF